MGGEIRLVVGLGNPGDRYADTRHNVGFRAVEAFADSFDVVPSWENPHGGKGLVAQLSFEDRRVWAAMPHTFMNASGEMVGSLARYYKIDPAAVLVVSDDFNLPLGRLRIRAKGSAGGQKGLESILRNFGTQEVPRLRLGIGPVPPGQEPSSFVLKRFRKEELNVTAEMIERSGEALRCICEEGLAKAMNIFNKADA